MIMLIKILVIQKFKIQIQEAKHNGDNKKIITIFNKIISSNNKQKLINFKSLSKIKNKIKIILSNSRFNRIK